MLVVGSVADGGAVIDHKLVGPQINNLPRPGRNWWAAAKGAVGVFQILAYCEHVRIAIFEAADVGLDAVDPAQRILTIVLENIPTIIQLPYLEPLVKLSVPLIMVGIP